MENLLILGVPILKHIRVGTMVCLPVQGDNPRALASFITFSNLIYISLVSTFPFYKPKHQNASSFGV